MGNKLLECRNNMKNITIDKRSMSISTTLGHINALILGNTMAKSQNESVLRVNLFIIEIKVHHSQSNLSSIKNYRWNSYETFYKDTPMR
jgi:hypothetical protein